MLLPYRERLASRRIRLGYNVLRFVLGFWDLMAFFAETYDPE